MERQKKTKILKLNLDTTKRMIFMSDIHGDVTTFKKALNEIKFSDDDYLFVVGDMIEKADPGDNIKMLNYMIELAKRNNVYFMAGNCDEVLRFILPPIDKKQFLHYALEKKKSIINDFAEEVNFKLSSDMDVDLFVDLLINNHPEYYEFVDSLPDVIFLNDTIVLVHGGIIDINNIPEEAIKVLKFDRFAEMSPVQEKIMIVGHYPTRNYRSELFNVNPIFDRYKRIISIDGGNNVVKGGQINVVILNSLDSMEFKFEAYDHYRKYKVLEDIRYEEPSLKFNMQFGDNEVTVLKVDLDYYFVSTIDNETMWVHKSFVYNYNDKYYCFDGSNRFISLSKGDEISIIIIGKPYCLVKKGGTIGLIESKYINEELIYDK